MPERELLSVLKTIFYLLQTKNFPWRLEGSANLLVQEVSIPINDLQICTNNDGFLIFKKVLAKYSPKEMDTEKIGRIFTVIINGMKVEVFCYNDQSLRMLDKIKMMGWKGMILPVLPLEYAKQYYQQIKRLDKVELITNFLKEQKGVTVY